ncbi:MAG: methionyl-tRNA formyltransferase [Acidobacteria bacterium]|nr:methionyl-tRNA formyltransferase [Acidobacteriota bacterium]
MDRGLPLRILYAATSSFAVPALEALVMHGARPVSVLTRPPSRAGRGQKTRSSAVQVAAEALGLPVLAPPRVNEPQVLEALSALTPDLLVVASYGQILKAPLLALPRLGCVNLHASLLPAWRGAAPVAHTLLAGDPVTGVTLMQMDEGLDTGPILACLRTPVAWGDDRGRLTNRLAGMAADLLVAHLNDIEAGRLPPVPQDDSLASRAPALKKTQGCLDWQRPAREVARRVRAFSPRPGAFTFTGSRRLLVRRVRLPAPGWLPPEGPPGTLGPLARQHGVPVRCGEGTGLFLVQVQPEGRGAMTAAAALHGRQLRPGQVLGQPTPSERGPC